MFSNLQTNIKFQVLVTTVLGSQPQWPLDRAASDLWDLWLRDTL